ncbi:Glycerol-3-phosphate acyltransferase 1, mitochondrial [Pteropus alecto]|uniref:Glycerol-3-phosphate acyltransferase 1, mitochondrial n=1 Tax=Pteropus alecto TaxID=9402 RepID=L5K2I9_PTEAL|nr:Glycerol-3-phosphate acyltransferase 1, mitochondrial [Pteropus alecto]
MDESALTLGTIDVSYLPNSSEYNVGRCKHSSEEWGECGFRPTVFRSATLKWKESFMSRKRPFVGRCCYSCTPQSWDKFFNPSIPSLGLRNVIYINETHTRHRGWLARRLSYVLFVQERDVHKGMFATNVTENVLNSSRAQEAIAEVAAELNPDGSAQQQSKAINKVRKRAKRILQEMVATVSPAMIRSHIDYLLLTFILFCHNIKAPYIASGNNLNIPIFSTLIHKLGGFFIRRRLDETPDGRKDILYRALLHGHIVELLRQQQFLEIFLEGTRSRSGKTSCARAGLLSVVVDTLYSNTIPDILIIPVGISYDRIIEGHYNGEQLGKPKKNESIWSVARGVVRMLRKNYGCVRVDFAQPFSLKEYLESQSQKPVSTVLSLEQALLPAILPLSTTVPSVFELNFYSNGVLHVFIMEAIIACSLYAVLNKRGAGGPAGTSPGLISQEQLVQKATSLCYLLSNEGTISLPCQTFYQNCHETVGRFIQYGILIVAEQDDQEDISPGLAEQQWDKKLPEPLSWRSDEEDEDSDFGEEQRDCYLKVSQSKEHQQFITFLQRLLGPLLEAYSSAAIFIHNFSGPVPEPEYLQKLHKYLLTRTERNVAVYAESATYCLVKNAVKMFKDIGVFKETKQKRVSVLELSSTFLPQCNRQKLLEYILSFVVL